jgi:hypothetical protein
MTSWDRAKLTVTRYDTLAEFVNIARKFTGDMHYGSTLGQYDGMRLNEACDYVLRGATVRETNPVRDLLEKIDASVHDRKSVQWVPELQGAYAIVPEYLMGLPDNMRTMTQRENDQAPVSIFVESSLSFSLDEEATARRGAAIAALAMRMGEERPVELYVFKTSQTVKSQPCWAAKLDVHPVNAAQCMAVFGRGAFCRCIGWAYLGYMGQTSITGINFGFDRPGTPGRANKIRQVFGLGPKDIIIEAGYAPDEALLQSDPVAWVHKQLADQRMIED